MNITFIMSPLFRKMLFTITEQIDQDKPSTQPFETLKKYLSEQKDNGEILAITEKEFLESLKTAFDYGSTYASSSAESLCNEIWQNIRKAKDGENEKMSKLLQLITDFFD